MESPRPALIPVDGPDYFAGAGTGKGNGKGKGKRVGASIDLGPAVKACMSPDRASPIAGPREQEIRGKALPCFKSLADGFMRITPETVSFSFSLVKTLEYLAAHASRFPQQLTLLQSGHFSNKHIANYQIIDCRFEYEYVGGHIKEAINLPSMSQIENVLLTADKRPRPSTSEEPLPEGRTVLIFHCEFSASRAPTS
jgi:M-phase inducer tyrosine phosphatase